MVKWRDGEIQQFLNLYELNECLWNPKSPKYRNCDERSAALKRIIVKMKLKMDENETKNKIKNIRTTYNRELTKILKSVQNGANSSDVYEPTLSWFKQADSFLRPVMEGKSMGNNWDQDQASESAMESNEISRFDQTSANACLRERPRKFVSHSKSIRLHRLKQLLKTTPTKNKVSKINSVAGGSTDDEFDIFAKHIAIQLRKLPLNRALICQNEMHSLMTKHRIKALGKSNISRQNSEEKLSDQLKLSGSTDESYDEERTWTSEDENGDIKDISIKYE